MANRHIHIHVDTQRRTTMDAMPGVAAAGARVAATKAATQMAGLKKVQTTDTRTKDANGSSTRQNMDYALALHEGHKALSDAHSKMGQNTEAERHLKAARHFVAAYSGYANGKNDHAKAHMIEGHRFSQGAHT
jgi:DUF1680 family protein